MRSRPKQSVPFSTGDTSVHTLDGKSGYSPADSFVIAAACGGTDRKRSPHYFGTIGLFCTHSFGSSGGIRFDLRVEATSFSGRHVSCGFPRFVALIETMLSFERARLSWEPSPVGFFRVLVSFYRTFRVGFGSS